MRKSILMSFTCLMFCNPAICSTGWITTRVQYAGTYGNGDVYVVFSDNINEPECTAPRIDVPATHPNARNILATAYAAIAAGLPVAVSTGGCFNGYPTLDTARQTGFMLRS